MTELTCLCNGGRERGHTAGSASRRTRRRRGRHGKRSGGSGSGKRKRRRRGGELLGEGPLMQWKIPLGQRAASGCPTTQWRCFWGTQGFPGSPVLGVVVLFACAQARYSVPEPRVCGRFAPETAERGQPSNVLL